MQISTTDIYYAAYIITDREQAGEEVKFTKNKRGGKVVFVFNVGDSVDPTALYEEYLDNLWVQKYITSIKEIRGDIYKTMKE
jgi:hypothetical protein